MIPCKTEWAFSLKAANIPYKSEFFHSKADKVTLELLSGLLT